MQGRMIFVIGAPRSGTTLLERMLSSHSMILGGPEPHLMTPLAHLGVWAKVEKASYDHILAAEAQRGFVQQLPNKEQDYWDACRAYCDVLYGRYLSTTSKTYCLDKTPAYALALPFITRVYPDAKYVVLTRHPAAVFSSYANTFFNGDYRTAHVYNPILTRYVPAIASFLREKNVSHIHVPYERLVQEPETQMKAVCDYIGVPFEHEMIAYGDADGGEERAHGLGDPTGVNSHTRPVADSLMKWAEELAADGEKRAIMQNLVAQLAPEDLETWGYPADAFFEPVSKLGGRQYKPCPRLTRYRLQRWTIVTLRGWFQRSPFLRAILGRVRLACEVLLRE